MAGSWTRRSGGRQLSTFSTAAAAAPEESSLGTAAFALADLLAPRRIQEPNHFSTFSVSSSAPKLTSRSQGAAAWTCWGKNVGDALLVLSSFPPAGFTPGMCRMTTAPLETAVRNCMYLPAHASRSCRIRITLVLRGFLQRSFDDWRCWFTGLRRCLHLENVSLLATRQVRTVQTHTRARKPTSVHKALQ